MKNTVTGLTVWVIRQSQWSDYKIIAGKKPEWLKSARCWRTAGLYLTDVCPELFHKYLGVHPPKHLKAGGEHAVQRATFYVALDWEGLK